MMRKTIPLLVLAATISVPAIAAETDAKSAPAAATDKGDGAAKAKDKMICRTEKITGTRSKVNRTCMTQREWDDLADQTRKSLTEFQQGAGRATQAKGPLGGG